MIMVKAYRVMMIIILILITGLTMKMMMIVVIMMMIICNNVLNTDCSNKASLREDTNGYKSEEYNIYLKCKQRRTVPVPPVSPKITPEAMAVSHRGAVLQLPWTR